MNVDADDSINPYAAPRSDDSYLSAAESQAGVAAPEYKLYAVRAVVLATFLGSLLAGGIVLGINLIRLQRTAAAWWVMVGGAVCTFAVIAIGAFIPDDVQIPNMVYLVPQLALAYGVANGMTGKSILAHQQARGKMASFWGAAGIGLLAALVVVAIVFGVLLMLPENV
jgi:hypothetical protein